MKTLWTNPHPARPALHRTGAAAAMLALATLLAGCGLSIPSDPDGTLDTVTDGELRVGASLEPGLVEVEDGDPIGPLPDLVTGFAKRLDAAPEWTVGSEETLVGLLEKGDLDLVIGGFTDKTLWVEKAGVTRGYPDIVGADGRSIVMLVPPGENAFLSRLERFLDDETGS